MSWPGNIILCGLFILLAQRASADVVVQLNINRPINDISEKFISFTMRPEDLYKALDSSNRKTLTRMASMLSHSHVKFVGDYHFAAKTEGIRLRNPTKIVWKGFNKWTKAVNWSMIIPVPYKPDNWDPMDTLKILNTSQMVDIDEVIWQLGTDFGTSRAADYVSELKTFNVMVDSFKHAVVNWQTMGADISAGSSPEETLRYIEMSRDLNAAYGWIQSEELFSSNSGGSPLDGQDPALKVLFRSKVPVWLTMPKKKALSLHMDDEVVEGFNWAQTMGEAANMGFDTIFKPFTLDDMERPTYSFYVTVLFKKIMGSRVYPARPLPLYGRNNKLYTHCASLVSGGLAFMVVNKKEQQLQLAVRSLNKVQDTEVWQYALTMENGQVMLNNNKLYINSTLTPEIRRKTTKSMLQLRTPGMSVSFWVLPNADLEHCHFTEVETPVVTDDHNQKIKRYSSSDRLLKELIKESAKSSFSPLGGLISRHRRSLDKEDRSRRFILQGSKEDDKPLGNFAENLVQDLRSPIKRELLSSDRRVSAIEWLSNIFKEPLNLDLPLLKRNVRQSNSLKGPFFMTRDGKKTAFTKKITEIKKPEKKIKKFLAADQEFDEEKFFKNVEEHSDTEYTRFPEGDVFLSNISPVDGSVDHEEEMVIEKKISGTTDVPKQEIVSEMKPLRLLRTEFFDSLPVKPATSSATKPAFASSYNSALFPDPFGEDLKEDANTKEIEKDSDDEIENNDEEDIVKAQIALAEKASKTREPPEEEKDIASEGVESILDVREENSLENTKPVSNVLSADTFNFFGDSTKVDGDKLAEDESVTSHNEDYIGKKFDETNWWDSPPKRLKRSLVTDFAEDSWQNNMISKDEEPVIAANELSPTRLHQFEQKVEEVVRNTNNDNPNGEFDEITFGKRIVKTFKNQFTKFVDLFSYHANEWYNTLAKQFDGALEETATTEGNRIIA